MATQIKPKRSSVPNNTPTTSNLESGELAVNMADRKIWINNGTDVIQVGAGTLAALSGISITNAASGDALVFNGTNWINTRIENPTDIAIAMAIALG
jgi:hypothetical protein